jgi:hypothetical protein
LTRRRQYQLLPYSLTSPLLPRLPPEVGRVGVLPRLDDRAAHGAGAGEQVEQLFAVAPADGALQRGEVLRKARQLPVERSITPESIRLDPRGKDETGG